MDKAMAGNSSNPSQTFNNAAQEDWVMTLADPLLHLKTDHGDLWNRPNQRSDSGDVPESELPTVRNEHSLEITNDPSDGLGAVQPIAADKKARRRLKRPPSWQRPRDRLRALEEDEATTRSLADAAAGLKTTGGKDPPNISSKSQGQRKQPNTKGHFLTDLTSPEGHEVFTLHDRDAQKRKPLSYRPPAVYRWQVRQPLRNA